LAAVWLPWFNTAANAMLWAAPAVALAFVHAIRGAAALLPPCCSAAAFVFSEAPKPVPCPPANACIHRSCSAQAGLFFGGLCFRRDDVAAMLCPVVAIVCGGDGLAAMAHAAANAMPWAAPADPLLLGLACFVM
jgi:hypothetical protein